MNSKIIGIILFLIGLLYMIIIGWLLSWRYVPDLREFGFDFITGSSFYSSNVFFTLWTLSIILGSILSFIGLCLYAKIEKINLLLFILGSILLLLWLGIWNQSSLNAPLYGVGGGIILICFIVSLLYWSKTRSNLEYSERLVSDLRVIGLIFFLIAAWGLCGTLGVPSSSLRSGLLLKFNTQNLAYTLGAKVLICLVLGWIFLAMSFYFESRIHKSIA
jgi:hypothetical protein